ncbi:hypothetical protein H9P43_001471 [Blastocladiella emersonii ATCC 22665]|nr:hypothetical protein H9P43_001471 [Blastocladiella emersonii ATCC 22665]
MPRQQSALVRLGRRVLHIVLFGGALGGIAVTSNVIQLVTLLLYPVHRRFVARINAKICEVVWRTIRFAMERHNGAVVTFSGDAAAIPINRQPVLLGSRSDANPPESAIVVSNHVCAIDWALINSLAARRGMLAHCKYFIKSSMQFVPLFGPGMRLAGFPFLNRNWAADKDKIDRVFRTLKSDRLPCWLISFLEGTRITPAKLAESQSFCTSRSLPVFEHVMYPRKKGFQATLAALRGTHVRFVYDVTLGYRHRASGEINTRAPSILAIHTDRLDDEWEFHVHVDRIAIDEIPEDDEGVGRWVEARWAAKDERIAGWHKAWPRVGVDGVVVMPMP